MRMYNFMIFYIDVFEVLLFIQNVDSEICFGVYVC